jgi:hypothetical protein
MSRKKIRSAYITEMPKVLGNAAESTKAYSKLTRTPK